MSTARLVWSVIVNIVAVLIVVAMFGKASGTFQTIVISGLTLIYVSLSSSTILLGHAHDQTALQSTKQFAQILQHLNQPGAADVYESLRLHNDNAGKIAIAMTIKGIFNLLLAAIAVFYLFSVL